MYHPRYNDILLFGGIGSFLAGVLVRSFIVVGPLVFLFLFVSAFLFCIFIFQAHRIYALFILLLTTLFIFGCLRFEIQEIIQSEKVQRFKIEETYHGKVVGEPVRIGTYQKFVVKIVQEDTSLKILATSNRYPEVSYGDKVTIQGTFVAPQNFITDSGKEFEYEQYLLKDNIYFLVPYAKVSITDMGNRNSLRGILFAGKQKFIDAINRSVPDPESALLGGILLGADESLGKELEQFFIDTGTIHIVVLSGYNVTIVSEALVKIFEYVFPKNIALMFGGFGIVLFALLSGASTTTIRASLMGLLGLLARTTKRNYEIIRAVFVAAFVMVLVNPFTLPYDISFQLSFIATLGLVLITPLIEGWKFITKTPQYFGLREIVSSSIAVQIAVLPFILYRMGTLSIIAPIVNVLILPTIPLSMGVGFLAGMIELVSGIGSNPVSWLSFGLLHYVIQTVTWFASFSWSAVVVKNFPLGIVLMLYAVILIWIFRNRRKILK